MRKLQQTIALAKAGSNFYDRHLSGFEPDSITSLKGLEALPFTSPVDCGDQLVCVPQRDISRIVTMETSGTSGIPKRVFFTEQDQQLTVDYFHHGMQHIIGPDDCLFIGMPCQRPGSIGDLLRTAVEGFGASVVPFGVIMGDEGLEAAVQVMKSGGVTAMVGLPAQMARLAQLTPNFTCKSVLLSAEYVSDEAVEFIGRQWRCEVFEHYGMTEMGLGCAVSCEIHEGYHVRESDLLIEIIDPATGTALPDGEWGEIVFTTLTRRGMPFIRYRTGDISRWIKDPCPCGSKLKRLDKVADRKMNKGENNNEG